MYSKETEQSRDAARDLSTQTQPPTSAAARQCRALSPTGKRQSPVLRPDSTVMSEERGAVPDASELERTQPASNISASDPVSGLSTTQSQRPPLWNPFLAAVTAASRVAGESERRPPDAGTLPQAKVGAGTKHSRLDDDKTLSPAKKRKTNYEVGVNESSSCGEVTDAGLRPSGQSPSSSTADTQVPPTVNGDPATGDGQDSGSACAPDSSCDEQSSTPDVKRFARVVKETSRSSVQKDLTVVGGVQETSSLLPVATQ